MCAAVSTRYLTLDHWRGIAALSVTAFHAFYPWLAGPHPQGAQWVLAVASQGWKGVHLFFVISGYCIGLLALREIRGHNLPGPFLANRLLRILPPYWIACLFAAAVALAAVPFNHVPVLSAPPLSGALPGSIGEVMRHLLLLDPLYPGSNGYLLVAWTLSWELFFYLTIAGLIFVATVVHTRLAIALGLALAIAGTLPRLTAFWPCLGGWAEFACGACLLGAETARTDGRPVWPWLLVIAGLGGAGGIANGASSMLPFAAIFALALHVLRRYDSYLANLRVLGWLGSAGTISYSLYLVHAPIISPMRNLLSRVIPPGSPWFILAILASAGAGLAGACLFYRWVEAPLELWRKSSTLSTRGSLPAVA